MTYHTYCVLCGEEFESEWHLRIMMWKWSHARRNHPDVFREALRQSMRIGRGERDGDIEMRQMQARQPHKRMCA